MRRTIWEVCVLKKTFISTAFAAVVFIANRMRRNLHDICLSLSFTRQFIQLQQQYDLSVTHAVAALNALNVVSHF